MQTSKKGTDWEAKKLDHMTECDMIISDILTQTQLPFSV